MLIYLFFAALVKAFDSGHHADLIGNALRLKGYSGLGVMIAQERSWLLEYFGLYERVNETSANAGLCATNSARRRVLGVFFSFFFLVVK